MVYSPFIILSLLVLIMIPSIIYQFHLSFHQSEEHLAPHFSMSFRKNHPFSYPNSQLCLDNLV